MAPRLGSSLDLDFSPGEKFSTEVFERWGVSVHPTDDKDLFALVVSFGRHAFRLDDDSVAHALESALGGSAIDFMVQGIHDNVFTFVVSCKQVGLFIINHRSYSCDLFKCYFHLWSNGGLNWKREFKLWQLECDAEWIIVSPCKKRASLAMLAMHKPPVKSSLKRSPKISQKKASFATFQAYDACKGYKCPVL